MKQSEIPVTSAVRPYGGVPTLFVNGSPIPGAAYTTYYVENNRYGDFSGEGYKLFSVSVFFATRPINDRSPLPPFRPGIFDDPLSPDFRGLDEDVKRVLAARPDAMIFLRVNTSLSYAWTESHPDELCDFGFQEKKSPCFSSDVWAEEVTRELRVFLSHIRESDYAAHIVGYHVAGGNTEEWIPFDMNASIGKRSREKFEKTGKTSEKDYYRFLSDTVADRIAEFASVVKEETEGRLVVGSFYGYTVALTDRKMAHGSLARLLASDAVDFLCSPISYSQGRAIGTDHTSMLPTDSVRLHGKLYFSENDTRTHLSAPPIDSPYFRQPVWYGPGKEQSMEIMKMHFSRALVHGHAFWWFDMWGGWYADPDYLKLVRRAKAIMADSLSRPRTPAGDFAVFVNETLYAAMDDPAPAKLVCSDFRKTLGHAAVAYDVFLLSDEESVRGKYRAAVFLSPAPDACTEKAIEKERTAGIAVLEVTPKNACMPASDLRKFLSDAGVPLYADGDLTVYESESYLFFHTGSADVRVRPLENVVELFGEKIPENGIFPAKRSFLFLKGGIENG